MSLTLALAYYFSTHGWSRVVSSLESPALALELLDAATAAARALLLKKEAVIFSKKKKILNLVAPKLSQKLIRGVLNIQLWRPPQSRRVST